MSAVRSPRSTPDPPPCPEEPVGGGLRREPHRPVQQLSPLAPLERHVIYGAHKTFRTPALLWPPGRQVVASLQRLCSWHDLGPKSGREGRHDGRTVAGIVASLLGCGERGRRIRPEMTISGDELQRRNGANAMCRGRYLQAAATGH